MLTPKAARHGTRGEEREEGVCVPFGRGRRSRLHPGSLPCLSWGPVGPVWRAPSSCPSLLRRRCVCVRAAEHCAERLRAHSRTHLGLTPPRQTQTCELRPGPTALTSPPQWRTRPGPACMEGWSSGSAPVHPCVHMCARAPAPCAHYDGWTGVAPARMRGGGWMGAMAVVVIASRDPHSLTPSSSPHASISNSAQPRPPPSEEGGAKRSLHNDLIAVSRTPPRPTPNGHGG